MGRVVGRAIPPEAHKHDYPATDRAYRDLGQWTVWECACGRRFRLEIGGAQYNETYYEWKPFPGRPDVSGVFERTTSR